MPAAARAQTHTQTYTLTTIANINAESEVSSGPGVTLDYHGNLYGTTYAGGPSNVGTVFRIAAGTRKLTTIAAFDLSNGAHPTGGLTLDGKGNLYGTAAWGGAKRSGTVFEIAAGTHAITTVATFTGSPAIGVSPQGGVTLDSAGNLYGTTTLGGPDNAGTVFKIDARTRKITTIAAFKGLNDSTDSDTGANPKAGIVRVSNGDLYGTTYWSGGGNRGTVFKIAAGTNWITTLVRFDLENGRHPLSNLIPDGRGSLYGTTLEGGTAFGTVFKIDLKTGRHNIVANFIPEDGYNLCGNVVRDSKGNLYGTTADGGIRDSGTVFKVAAGAKSATTLVRFRGNASGANPLAGLAIDRDGCLYGTTTRGGVSGRGTVFKLTPDKPRLSGEKRR